MRVEGQRYDTWKHDCFVSKFMSYDSSNIRTSCFSLASQKHHEDPTRMVISSWDQTWPSQVCDTQGHPLQRLAPAQAPGRRWAGRLSLSSSYPLHTTVKLHWLPGGYCTCQVFALLRWLGFKLSLNAAKTHQLVPGKVLSLYSFE